MCRVVDRAVTVSVSPQRSHSAFSLLDNDPPRLIQDSPLALKKEGSGSTLSTWKSVDRLDNAGEIPMSTGDSLVFVAAATFCLFQNIPHTLYTLCLSCWGTEVCPQC